MAKINVVLACEECDYFAIDIHPFQYFCVDLEIELTEPSQIHKDCPLEDYKPDKVE